MTQQPAEPKRYGVLIAASLFPDEPKLLDLQCPERDVDGMHAVLSDGAVGGFSEVRVIKNQPSHAVLRGVHDVLRKAGRNDLVLIYYAGHGKLDRAGRLHLATSDTLVEALETTSVPAHRLRDLIDNADTTKTALLLDCCYSGAIEKSFLRGGLDEQLNIMSGGRGTFIMTASTDIQTAREVIEDGYGVFTKHMIDGIRGGAADADGDGVITMNELYRYVHGAVPADSHQVPMKWDLNVQGELVIAKTGRKPRDERRRAIRERLFALADAGTLPDLVLTKALEMSGLSYAETRSGAAARYDALLDRLLAEEVTVGWFVNEWLQVQPDPELAPKTDPEPAPKTEAKAEPKPESKPEPETVAEPKAETWAAAAKARRNKAKSGTDSAQAAPKEDAQPVEAGWFWKLMVFPYAATQENLDRNPLYAMTHGGAVRKRRKAAGKRGLPWYVWAIIVFVAFVFLVNLMDSGPYYY